MIISERTYRFSYNLWIVILGASLIFRIPATVLLMLFAAYNLFFFKKMRFTTHRIWMMVLIASPFLLDLLFLWNNDSLTEGLKHGEKRLALLLLPVCFLSQTHRFNTMRVLRYYAWLFTAILFVCFIRFAWVEPELFLKYLSGRELWEMGYAFSESTGNHAPALNMHMAFVVVINFYFIINKDRHTGIWSLVLRMLSFVISVILLLYINTRLAIAFAFMGIILVSLYQFKSAFNLQRIKKISLGVLIFGLLGAGFVKLFPYSVKKFSSVTFAHLDKVGKLDDFENPEDVVFNGLVTRLSIWKSGLEVAKSNLITGVGAADGKRELIQHYKATNQRFLAKYEFPTHNQYLDFLIKFGILGFLICILYIGLFMYIGLETRQVLCLFLFLLFGAANMVDDFLIRFDGIVFSGLWLSFFAQNYVLDYESRKRAESQNYSAFEKR